MTPSKRERHFKFFLYLIVIVLINVAGSTLFFRWDLTKNNMYSLSPVSREVVTSLSEPLTVKAFFSRDLPPPYNTYERYLKDLLEEYRLEANRHFNYSFINPGPESEEDRQLAESYGISPIQVEVIKEDELQYKKVYMGLVLIHGDVVEKISRLTSINDLEYRLSSSIEKMKNKVSALLNLSGKISLKFYLSSSLEQIAPLIGLEGLMGLTRDVRELVAELNTENYQKLEYVRLDPSRPGADVSIPEANQLQTLKWPNLQEEGIKAGQGSLGLVLEHQDQVKSISVLEVLRMPLFGTQYKLIEKDQLKASIDNSLKSMLGINRNIGYLTGHGIPSLSPRGGQQQGQRLSVAAFRQLVNQSYTLQPIDLQQGVPEGLEALLIAGPTQPFSQFELYQLDQALMRGTNLGLFLDGLAQVNPAQRQGMQQPPQFGPNRTGLERLLTTYGIRVEESLLLDENCYKQRMNRQMGGGERPIYYAPIIKNANINKRLPFMQNIKGLVALKNSPLQPLQDTLDSHDLDLQILFSSSKQSWTMSESINLNPMFLSPPDSGENMFSRPLAALISGSFPSHFAGRPIPEQELEQEPESGAEASTGEPSESTSEVRSELTQKIGTQGKRRNQSRPAKISIIGSSDLLSDSVVDAQGSSVNSIFLMNLLDELNNRTGMAKLRSKIQQFNPILETDSSTRMWIKALNIAGLPILVLVFGLLVWAARSKRKNQIRMMFAE